MNMELFVYVYGCNRDGAVDVGSVAGSNKVAACFLRRNVHLDPSSLGDLQGPYYYRP